MFVGIKETKEWLAVSDCLLEKVVGLLGELPYSLSDSTKPILIL